MSAALDRAESDRRLLELAVREGARASASEGSYSVGAVVATAAGDVLATGHTRERGGRGHAEEVALAKAAERGADLGGAHLFSSMEPCSRRLSGRRSCAALIIEAGIARVVFCALEPPVFVRCEGEAVLRAAGIEVVHDPRLVGLVFAANRHLLEGAPRSP